MSLKAPVTFQTGNAARHLAMLCSHFGKKVVAKCDDNKGWVKFPFGRWEMTANNSQLKMRVVADEQSQRDPVMRSTINRLERFAFRKDTILAWQAQSKQPALPATTPFNQEYLM